MHLEVTTSADSPPDEILLTEGIYWFLRSAFDGFTEATGIEIDIEGCAEIEAECLLELFLSLEPLANDVRSSSAPYLEEIGLAEGRDQITLYQTPREDGLAMIERLMDRANEAFNEGATLLIRGVGENQSGESGPRE